MVLGKGWQEVQWVFTDVDDTLTWEGRLPVDSLQALYDLEAAGIQTVAVTGACSGWGDHMAQLWPLRAVISENGAACMERLDGKLHLATDQPIRDMRLAQAKLRCEVDDLLQDYPDLGLTIDQSYRICEVAIDIGQNRDPVDTDIVTGLAERIRALGANATISSIHINAWYGQHSKISAILKFLARQGVDETTAARTACYIGDSPNDQGAWARLPLGAGVSNVRRYLDRLETPPAIIMERPGGFGFAQFAQQLLALK